MIVGIWCSYWDQVQHMCHRTCHTHHNDLLQESDNDLSHSSPDTRNHHWMEREVHSLVILFVCMHAGLEAHRHWALVCVCVCVCVCAYP